MMMWYGFFSADMIIKHEDRQIKAGLMKDRHQSAASLEMLLGMTCLSRRRNMVTHPSLISLSWPIDWAFISISPALIAAIMNGQAKGTLRKQNCEGNKNNNKKNKYNLNKQMAKAVLQLECMLLWEH